LHDTVLSLGKDTGRMLGDEQEARYYGHPDQANETISTPSYRMTEQAKDWAIVAIDGRERASTAARNVILRGSAAKADLEINLGFDGQCLS
jgi:hypothetical protein